jgi:alkaline phosphatase
MAAEIAKGADVENTLKSYIDQNSLALTAQEIQSVKTAAGSKKVTDIDNAIEAIFNKRSHTGWTTGGHTGEDVPVYAFGPYKERFAGQVDNTDHAKIIFELLGNGNK